MKNVPEKIYLQIGDDCYADDFNECDGFEITWSSTKVFDNDIEYQKIEEPKSCRSCKVKLTCQMEAKGTFYCHANLFRYYLNK